MRRPLSGREQQILLVMIDRARPAQEMPAPTQEDRDGWRSSVPELTVDEVCGCGQCPSISLTTSISFTSGQALASNGAVEQSVLTAFLADALVILFLENGAPSYLELAPLDDTTLYTEFPDASALEF